MRVRVKTIGMDRRYRRFNAVFYRLDALDRKTDIAS